MANECCIFDLGASTCKLGIAGFDAPQVEFASRFANDAQLGDAALQASKSIFQQHGTVSNWYAYEKMLQHGMQQLPACKAALVAHAPLLNLVQREQVLQLYMEKFQFQYVSLVPTAVLNLYSRGLDTGCCVDMGHDSLIVTAVHQSKCVKSANWNVAGSEMTNYLISMICNRGFATNYTIDTLMFQDMKHQMGGYVAQNPSNETNPSSYVYNLPDGNTLTIDRERFMCPEVVFQPELLGRENEQGIHCITNNTIISVHNDDIQKQLYKNIVLAGGSSSFAGMSKRLKQELHNIVNDSVQIGVTGEKANNAYEYYLSSHR